MFNPVVLLLLVGAALAFPVDELPLVRVTRGVNGVTSSSYGQTANQIVFDSKALAAQSVGSNAFVASQVAAQDFQSAAGQGSYLASQIGLQQLGAASAGAAWASFGYDAIASSAAGYH